MSNHRAALALALAAGLFTSRRADASRITFPVDASVSTVDLTTFGLIRPGLFSPEPLIASTRDTQTIPLSGSVTLDVELVGFAVQSVDFVSLTLGYVADLSDPVVFSSTTLVPDPFNSAPPGVDSEVRLPFDSEAASGNPVPVVDPTLTLVAGDAGVETGTGGDLSLTGPVFRFEATGQSFGETSTPDGFPVIFGPYPNSTPFPDMPPADRSDVTFDPGGGIPDFPTTPAPAGPTTLDGVLSVVDGALVFQASFFSFGAGGAGSLVYPQVHDGAIEATILPGDYNGDGAVDAADYTVWRDTVGTPAGALLNDIDGGVVDDRQYATWTAFFGAELPASVGSSVPSPSAGVLLSTALAAALLPTRSCGWRTYSPADCLENA